MFLLLPSDKEAIHYLKNYGNEIDQISGDSALVITFGDRGIKRPHFESDVWISSVEEHISNDYSVKVAELFNIEFDKFPCLIVFNDIRSSEHIVITLKGLTGLEIANKLRLAFSIIKKAVGAKENPVKALNIKRKEEGFLKRIPIS